MSEIRHIHAFVAAAIGVLLIAIPALAQPGIVVPHRIAYQGRLPGVTGSHAIDVRIWDAPTGGGFAWTKSFPAVPVVNGAFSLVLEGASSHDSSVDIVEAFQNPDRYIALLVDGAPAGPRQRLASAPFAIVAESFVPDEMGEPSFSFIPNAATINLPGCIPKQESDSDPDTVLAAEIQGFEIRAGSLLHLSFQAFNEFTVQDGGQITLGSTTASIMIESVGASSPPLVLEQSLSAMPARDRDDMPVYLQSNQELRFEWIGPLPNDATAATLNVSVFLTNGGPRLGDSYCLRALTVREVFQENDDLRTILPTAEFSADLRNEPFPVTVRFTDESDPGSAPIEAWLWDFGDGIGNDVNTGEPLARSTLQHPSHRYTRPGTYTVSLTVRTVDGEHTTAKVGYITVEELK